MVALEPVRPAQWAWADRPTLTTLAAQSITWAASTSAASLGPSPLARIPGRSLTGSSRVTPNFFSEKNVRIGNDGFSQWELRAAVRETGIGA